MAERQTLGDAVGVGWVDKVRRGEAPAALGILGLEQMAFACVTPQDFASSGYFKPLGHGFFRFDAFRTSHKCVAFSLEKSGEYSGGSELLQEENFLTFSWWVDGFCPAARGLLSDRPNGGSETAVVLFPAWLRLCHLCYL